MTKEEREYAKQCLEDHSRHKGTICDCLRTLYEGTKDNPEMREVCMVALIYAKRMDKKLREYKTKT